MRQGHTITGHSRDTVPILAGRIIFSYVVLTFTFFTVFRLTWPIPDALDSGILRYAAFFCILPSILIGLRGRWQNLFADIRIVENFSWSWRNFLIFFIPVGLILSSIIFVATTVSYSPGIRVWDVENEEFVASFDTAQFFAYKNQLFVYDNESPVIEAWNPKEQIFSLANGVSNIILQSDEGNPLFITFDETSTRFWSIENGLEIAASMSGSYVDSWPSQSLVVTGIDGIETLWDITDGVLLVGNIKNDWRNEDFLIVTNDAGRSRVFRKDNGQEIVISEDIDTGIVRAAEKFSFVLTENEGGTTQFLNSVDGTLLGKIQNNWQDDGFFNVVDKDGNVRIFYYYGRGFDLSENIDGMFTWISNNNSLVITKNENELSQLWHNKDGAFLGIIQNDWQIDGSLVITKNENGLSQLWHDEDGVFLGSIQNDWQTDDFFVIEKEDGRTSVLDRSNNQTIVLSENIEGKIVWATINGSLVITEDANRTPQLWQSRDGILLGNIQNEWQTDDFFVIEKEDGRISVLDRFNDQTIVLSENIEGNIVWVTINGSLAACRRSEFLRT